MTNADRSPRFVLLFWAPLAAQWLMMGLEGPFLAAVIARLGEPTFNLAAHGVAYAIAILVESPVIMLMSASTALVEDAASYRKLRRFANGLNALATGMLLLVLVPPVFRGLMDTLLGLPPEVTRLVYGALWLLLPWPTAIGDRRFLHGVLIRAGQTRRVAYGTLLRLLGMGGTALGLAFTDLPGAWVGAASLSAGVVVEALAARWMAAGAVRTLLHGERLSPVKTVPTEPETGEETGAGAEDVTPTTLRAGPHPQSTARSYREIARFYYPLALTSFIGLTVQPLLTFFMGHAPAPVQSLALFPVVNSLAFLFRTIGLSFQEAAIALLGRENEHVRPLGRFAGYLAVASSAGLALVAFTPLASFWFGSLSGLPPDLAVLAVVPTQVVVLLPALSVVLSFQRAVLVQQRRTGPITTATVVEVLAIAALFPLFGWGWGLMGVTAAMLAFVTGRLGGVLFLVWPFRAAVRQADDARQMLRPGTATSEAG